MEYARVSIRLKTSTGIELLRRWRIANQSPKANSGIMAHHNSTSGSVIDCRKFVISHGKGANIRYKSPIGTAEIAPSVVETSTSSPKPDSADVARSKRLL